uniref:Uncharacterized protein n=1 Tax=Steinernema glaseri TaxID=37863 RepID=A0A1I8AEL3_9BILA
MQPQSSEDGLASSSRIPRLELPSTGVSPAIKQQSGNKVKVGSCSPIKDLSASWTPCNRRAWMDSSLLFCGLSSFGPLTPPREHFFQCK